MKFSQTLAINVGVIYERYAYHLAQISAIAQRWLV